MLYGWQHNEAREGDCELFIFCAPAIYWKFGTQFK